MSKVNIVIPMAGAGSRFSEAGYEVPKPFIHINGKMMIERVLDGLAYDGATYTLIIQRSFRDTYGKELQALVNLYDVKFVELERMTQGAACTALLAHHEIDPECPVIFADSDNIFQTGIIDEFLNNCGMHGYSGALVTFNSSADCYSYAELDKEGLVTRTVEKEVVSDYAIAGIYYFETGATFVDAAIKNVCYGNTTKGEYYVSNLYNCLVQNRERVGVHTIEASRWNCVGTPAQLDEYLKYKNS